MNCMIKSLVLLESVINSCWFLRTSIILFLNKIDVFKTPEDTSPKILPRVHRWRGHQQGSKATDTSNMRLVFAAVKETILQNALKDSGIL